MLKTELTIQTAYSLPVEYLGIKVYPVTMKDYYSLQALSDSITFRKESRVPDVDIIRMSYLEFILYTYNNTELCEQYDMPQASRFWVDIIFLLSLVCKIQPKQVVADLDENKKPFLWVDEHKVTAQQFDNIRRIIITQNGIDYDMDTFINYDTERKLNESTPSTRRDSSTLEDYIDSLCIATNYTPEAVADLPVRKFWRFIKRINLYDTYKICKTGEASGFVTYKDPIQHWMSNVDSADKYKDKIISEEELRHKIE